MIRASAPPCEGAGYDRDFARLSPDPRPAIAVPSPGPSAVWLSGRLLRTRPGTVLDLNGIVKSMAVDAALSLLSKDGWVSAGGDLAATAAVDVSLPGNGAVRLERGGLATSGSTGRRWWRGAKRATSPDRTGNGNARRLAVD